MDDGFHHRDDEAVLGVRATRVSGWRRSEAADDRRPGGGKGTQGKRLAAKLRMA
jgi:hypothetical protein